MVGLRIGSFDIVGAKVFDTGKTGDWIENSEVAVVSEKERQVLVGVAAQGGRSNEADELRYAEKETLSFGVWSGKIFDI